MGGGAGLAFPGGRIAPVHHFCFLHVVVLHLYPTNCGGFNGFNAVIKFEQNFDAYQVSQGWTMGQLKPLKIIPSYRLYANFNYLRNPDAPGRIMKQLRQPSGRLFLKG